MKQKIIDALKAKFSGVSDAILGRIADKLAKTVTTEEQVATAVEGVTFQQVLESYGDSRATEAQATAVKNYETKHGLKDGKPAEQPEKQKPDQNQKPGDDTPAWAKNLIEANHKLNERLDAMESEKVTTGRKARLAEITSKLPEHLRKAYERTPVDGLTDEAFESMATEISNEVAELTKDSNARGTVFGRPSSSAGGKDQKELTKEQLEAISKREGVPSAEGQPF